MDTGPLELRGQAGARPGWRRRRPPTTTSVRRRCPRRHRGREGQRDGDQEGLRRRQEGAGAVVAGTVAGQTRRGQRPRRMPRTSRTTTLTTPTMLRSRHVRLDLSDHDRRAGAEGCRRTPGYLSAKATVRHSWTRPTSSPAQAQANAGVAQAYAAYKAASRALKKAQAADPASQKSAAQAAVTQAQQGGRARRRPTSTTRRSSRRSTAPCSSTPAGAPALTARPRCLPTGSAVAPGCRAVLGGRPRRLDVHRRGRRGRHRSRSRSA